MIETVEHLLTCGFRVIDGYTESDEISLLFHPDEELFGRRLRTYNSVLAGEASAKLSLILGDAACFDCRISELPRPDDVVDYFRWRSEDAHRNALSAHWSGACGRKEPRAKRPTGACWVSPSRRRTSFCSSGGGNFNDLPAWQKRGVGLYWEEYEKEAVNPQTGERVTAICRRIRRDYELPRRDAYSRFIAGILSKYSA